MKNKKQNSVLFILNDDIEFKIFQRKKYRKYEWKYFSIGKIFHNYIRYQEITILDFLTPNFHQIMNFVQLFHKKNSMKQFCPVLDCKYYYVQCFLVLVYILLETASLLHATDSIFSILNQTLLPLRMF